MEENRPSGDRPATERLTIPEAARALGVSSEAVRGRVKRGTLESERGADGTVYVLLNSIQPTAGQSSTNHQPTADTKRDQSELVEELRAQNAYLRARLEEADTRDRENRRLLAATLERLPELGPPKSQESSEEEVSSSAKEPERVTGQETGEEQQRGAQRPWWRRIFGGRQ